MGQGSPELYNNQLRKHRHTRTYRLYSQWYKAAHSVLTFYDCCVPKFLVLDVLSLDVAGHDIQVLQYHRLVHPLSWNDKFVVMTYFQLQKDSKFAMRWITYEVWSKRSRASIREYNFDIITDDPDLSGLRKSGSKMLHSHDRNNEMVPITGKVHCYQRTLALDPDAQEYHRFFITPGASHCSTNGLVPPVRKMIDIMVD